MTRWLRFRGWWLIAAALGYSVCGHAAVTIVSVTGPNPSDGQDVRLDGNSLAAVHWTASATYTNVTISAQLYCTPCGGKNDSSYADVYLTKQIGPTTTASQQVAFARVKVTAARGFVTLFSGLTLVAGDYYLVIYSPFTSQSGPIGPGVGTAPAVAWGGTSDANAVVVTTPGASREQMLIYANNASGPLINAQFPPSSFFFRSPTTSTYDLSGAYNLQYQVTSTPAIVVPQFVTGSGWKTSLSMVNLDQSAVNYDVRLWSDDGKPLSIPLTSPEGLSTTGTLAPGGAYFADAVDNSSALKQGWVEVVASGKLGVSAIIRRTVSGTPPAETSVAGVNPGSSVSVTFDNTQNFVTSFALANGNPTQTLAVTLIAQLPDGTQQRGTVSVSPHGHSAFALSSVIPETAGVRGSLLITASSPDLAAVGLRFDPSGSFTSLSNFQ